MITMSTLASVVTRAWGVVNKQGGGIRFVDAKFTKPVKVGETVTATGTVKRKHHHGPGKNWVQIAVEAKDSTGDLIGLAEVGYALPDSPSPAPHVTPSSPPPFPPQPTAPQPSQ